MLTREKKLEVFNVIVSTPSFLGKYQEHDGVLAFLNKIWNLKEMPSEDGRFNNAYDDTHKHIINNDDWTTEYLYLERFKLIDGEEKYFISFIETVVSPTVRKTKEEIIQFVSKINGIIQSTGFKLILTDYFEELPVYKYRDSANLNDLPSDIIANKIPIYLAKGNSTIEYPSFFLGYDKWNDHTIITMFDLIFREDASTSINLGKVKIMKRNEKTTWDVLPEKFISLSNDCCSLGQDRDYYIKLKKILGGDFYSFLLALRDVAIFPRINEEFESDNIYKTSLIRDNSVERLSRTIRFEIEGIKPEECYKFNYTHQPPYAENAITLNFDFEYDTDLEHRIYALIGKNGTGKTRILSSLAKDLSEKEPLNFSPRKPVYGKVFTVSYSFFDKFEIPNSDASFNYVYCGLKKNKNTWKSDEEMLVGFYESVLLIKKKELENDWYLILKNFIAQDILDIVFTQEINIIGRPKYIFNESKFGDIHRTLSSGQSIMLFMISEILSQIRFDSLILFDEPETHLHPNAISALLNTLFDLVKKFESFCIIATHSPLIIQEIPSRNIFVIERENNSAFVRELERESFGENLTVITQDIFGNRDTPKHFVTLIKGLMLKGKSPEEIIKILESDNLPMTSNIRLYVKALTKVE